MLFNSFEFLIFFTILFLLYISLGHRWRNYLLLIGSYIFYGSWDWRFLSLLIISTGLDYFCGLRIDAESSDAKRKRYLVISVCGNLLILGFFKYFNFFAENLTELLSFFNLTIRPLYLDIILPVGISFYTFQTMSYSIDVYRREIKPTRNFLDFALFVSFFPQLVAGPIERAKHLLPQILGERSVTLEKFYDGAAFIFWGLFQKVYVADNLAALVDPVFESRSLSGVSYLIAGYAFMLQLYCDFAGYSNIAKGLGKMMGFDIMTNFNFPFFACNVREFWKRWHISLTSWIRDYLYDPMVGNSKSKWRKGVCAVFAMSLIGLWHGPSWHFVLFGFYSGLGIVGYYAIRPWLARLKSALPKYARAIFGVATAFLYFQMLLFGFIFFRAQSVGGGFHILSRLLQDFSLRPEDAPLVVNFFMFALPLLLMELWQYRSGSVICYAKSRFWIRVPVYLVLFYLILLFGVSDAKAFIYFQF